MECKLTAHDSQWAGRDLIRIKGSWVYRAWVQMWAWPPLRHRLSRCFADWVHTSVSHEAHHRCLSPLARLTHRSAVCSATEAARKRSVVPSAQHPQRSLARSTSALQLFSWNCNSFWSYVQRWLFFFLGSDTPGWWKCKNISRFLILRQTDQFSCLDFKLLKSRISHQGAPDWFVVLIPDWRRRPSLFTEMMDRLEHRPIRIIQFKKTQFN